MGALKHGPHGGKKVGSCSRLKDVTVSGRKCFFCNIVRPILGKEKNFRRRRDGSDPSSSRYAVQQRKADIQKYEVWSMFLGLNSGF